MSDKTILEQWRAIAYDQQADRNKLQRFWANYFNIEKGIYEQLLSNPDEVVTGTVKELAEKYGQEVLTSPGRGFSPNCLYQLTHARFYYSNLF